MTVVKTLLLKIGHLLLNIFRVLRRAICCRKKRQEAEYLLPMTIDHVINIRNEDYDLHSWESWNESENSSSLNSESDHCKKGIHEEDFSEDFFKDMVPEIKKPKKLYIRDSRKESDQERSYSNRLAMDPKAILSGPDLGVIEDNPTNWEDSENLEEIWNPDELIKEKRLAEREKRLAEHQRRKQERESRRALKQELFGSLPTATFQDRTKHS